MDKKTFSLPGITFTGDITIQGDMFNIHDNENVYIDGVLQKHKEKENDTNEAPEAEDVDDEANAEIDQMELPEKEEVNFFAPSKNLKVFLAQAWFADLRTEPKYTIKWCEKFVDDLMASEWGYFIAAEWASKAKRLGVRGNIIGALKQAGVLKGSDLSIAGTVTQSNAKTIKTFAVYIGRGRKKPYCDWVYDYVNP
jgi:hypothetical protein